MLFGDGVANEPGSRRAPGGGKKDEPMKKTGVGKWNYSRVNWKIVMTRVNYDRGWVEQREMTKWECFKYLFVRLRRSWKKRSEPSL